MSDAEELCTHCGAPHVAGFAACKFCKTPFVKDTQTQAIPCPQCHTLNEMGAQRCVQCQAWVVVQCVFCHALSPHNVPACTKCNEAFAGAPQRFAEQQRQQHLQQGLNIAGQVGNVAASFIGAAAGAGLFSGSSHHHHHHHGGYDEGYRQEGYRQEGSWGGGAGIAAAGLAGVGAGMALGGGGGGSSDDYQGAGISAPGPDVAADDSGGTGGILDSIFGTGSSSDSSGDQGAGIAQSGDSGGTGGILDSLFGTGSSDSSGDSGAGISQSGDSSSGDSGDGGGWFGGDNS